MIDIPLTGCNASSLPGYLKALGILRLVADQIDSSARGYWGNGNFVLRTKLSKTELSTYFLREYAPSPIISPWSGRAGFLEGDDGKQSKRKGVVIINRIEHSSGVRFKGYRSVIASIRGLSVITRLDKVRAELKKLEKLKKSKKIDQDGLDRLSEIKHEDTNLKSALLLSVRGELSDAFLPWIDACFSLAIDARTPGPLLGSGGNEGSMDFSINHVGYLLDLIDENSDEPTPLAKKLLSNALWGDAQFFDSRSNIGFLDTLATGGVNMSTGFDGHSSGNIWDSVLTMEGAVLFASATTKKLESTGSGRPSFPFSVSPSYAGGGSIASKESARPEMWLPIWHISASIREINELFAEGRTTLGKRQAKNGLDMLQALSSLGVNRGIVAFERYGFFERRGQGYFVTTHLGRYEVPEVQSDSWIINDLEQHGWLRAFQRFAQGDNTANRFRALCKQLEDQFFDLSGHAPTKAEMQSLLILLGNIQQALASSSKARESVLPLPRLSERWVEAADDGSIEFRIAKALAGLHGIGDEPLPLRAQLFPVRRKFDEWMTAEAGEKVRIYTGQKARLIDTLRALLEHRLQLAERLEMKGKPLASPAGVMLADVADFLQDRCMDARIAALLPGLCLCAIPEDTDRTAGEGMLPAAFGLMKLALTPDRTLRSFERKGVKLLSESDRVPVPAGMLAQLAAGNHGNRAVQIACRRLRASGLVPFFANTLPTLAGVSPTRAAAALLIPLRYGATGALVRTLLEEPETEADPATTT